MAGTFRYFAPIILNAALIVLIIIFKNKIKAFKHERLYLRAIGAAGIIGLIVEQVWPAAAGLWQAEISLPVSICTLTELFVIYTLFTGSQKALDLIYFSMVGATQAFLTPVFTYGPLPLPFVCYVLKHTILMVMPIYMVVVHGYLPTQKTVWKYVAAVMCFAAITVGINAATGGNYLYLSYKAEAASKTLLSYMGPYPWCFVTLFFAGLAICYLYYLPAAFARRRRRKQEEAII